MSHTDAFFQAVGAFQKARTAPLAHVVVEVDPILFKKLYDEAKAEEAVFAVRAPGTIISEYEIYIPYNDDSLRIIIGQPDALSIKDDKRDAT